MAFDENEWLAFHEQDMSERAKYFMPADIRSGQPKILSCIFPHQFKRALLEDLFELADAIRAIQDSRAGAQWLKSLLADKSLMEYFAQASTRTWASHWAAAADLGMSIADIRDVQTSSEIKGEHPLDSVRTLSELFDAIAMRHPKAAQAEKVAWHLSRTRRPIGVINAGSGPDLHVTQALLNYYTITRKLGSPDDKVMLMTGDLKRSRTLRTDAYLAREFRNMVLLFCAPPEFQMRPDILEFLDKHEIRYEVHHDLLPQLPRADIVSVVRMQDEHDKKIDQYALRAGRLAEDVRSLIQYVEEDMHEVRSTALDQLGEQARALISHIADKMTNGSSPRHLAEFSITEKSIQLVKPGAIIMHPLPRRDELDWRCDQDPRVVIWSMVRNGRWVRAALLAMMFGADDEIRLKNPKLFKNPNEFRWRGI